MGIGSSNIPLVSFEDVQYATSIPDKYYIICTLPIQEVAGLIPGTLPLSQEEHLINLALSKNKTKDIHIIIYGKHLKDETTMRKYTQLKQLGFCHIYIYQGGLFEWLLLQDIYGEQSFPTTIKTTDILIYKPPEILKWASSSS